MTFFAKIKRDDEVIAQRVRVHLNERPGLLLDWDGSFDLDLRHDPDAGEWVKEIVADAGPQDPGCLLVFDDERTGTFYIEYYRTDGRHMTVRFAGTGPLE